MALQGQIIKYICDSSCSLIFIKGSGRTRQAQKAGDCLLIEYPALVIDRGKNEMVFGLIQCVDGNGQGHQPTALPEIWLEN